MNDETNPEGPNLEPLQPVDPLQPAAPLPSDSDPTMEDTVPLPPAGEPPGEAPPARPSWKMWVAVATTAAVVGAGAVFGISAATSSDSSDPAVATQNDSNATGGSTQEGQGGPVMAGRGGGFGTISEIDGSSLTIKDQRGETTKVKTSSDTVVTTSADGSVDDIKVGDTVTVVGSGSATEIAATRVTDNGKVSDDEAENGPGGTFREGAPNGMTPPEGVTPPEGMTPPDAGGGRRQDGTGGMTRGVVKSVGDGTFTVTSINDTEVTVTTSSDTTVTVSEDADVSDLKVGDTIVVTGEEADGTITATRIREGAMNGPVFNGPGGPPETSSSASGSDDAQ